VATVAVGTGQPVGDLLDLLGMNHEWPEVFDVLHEMVEIRSQATDVASREAKRQQLLADARRRFGRR
jgi:hypothetical protein